MSFLRLNQITVFGGPSAKGGKAFFWRAKRVFDVGFSLILLLPLAICALALLVLNPFWNRGPLFFRQTRMGKDCSAFKAVKFRSMRCERITRGADDPIESERITKLGTFLRRTRMDELPQVMNVLKGDMSLIGPRPDYFTHAKAYVRQVPGYRDRHSIRPGISGLAQVDVGYVQGIDGTAAKVRADLIYIQQAGFALDVQIFWKTLKTVVGRKGT